jgi:hypothetical protein
MQVATGRLGRVLDPCSAPAGASGLLVTDLGAGDAGTQAEEDCKTRASSFWPRDGSLAMSTVGGG